MNRLLAVALGSGVGATLRFALSQLALGPAWPGALPATSLVANVLGAALIGAYAGWFRLVEAPEQTPGGRYFFMAGVCGGLTTFSIFSLEVLLLTQEGLLWTAGAYMLTSLLLWLGAAGAGYGLGSWLAPAKTQS